MNKLNRITIMIDNELLKEITSLQIRQNQYSRSETIRQLIIKSLKN